MAESTDAVPQFATAEYVSPTDDAKCRACGGTLGDSHFRINGQPACAECTKQIRARFPADSQAAFVRGLLFGIGGAVLGLILYIVFAISTGLVIGFVSLAVGYMVGKAMVMGSGGRGGRRYQIAALLLTYAAVSLSAVPIALWAHHADLSAGSLVANAGQLAWLGLASPFLDLSDPAHGLIGLIILFVGLRIAWKLTAGKSVDIVGPVATAPIVPG